jgi:hypothetical protein
MWYTWCIEINFYLVVRSLNLTTMKTPTNQGKLPNGVYPYQIVQDGKKVSEGKIVVTH